MKKELLGKAIACRHKMSEEDVPKAGYSTKALLSEIASRHPHLRPCPRYNWKWIYKTSCDYCRMAVFEE